MIVLPPRRRGAAAPRPLGYAPASYLALSVVTLVTAAGSWKALGTAEFFQATLLCVFFFFEEKVFSKQPETEVPQKNLPNPARASTRQHLRLRPPEVDRL